MKSICFIALSMKTKKFDINDQNTWKNLRISKGDKLIFLSWQNLPNYGSDFHILENLYKSIAFLKELAKTDITTVVCAGTCFEYGLQSGCLEESLRTDPVNNYAIAKDTLRRVVSNTFSKEKINLAAYILPIWRKSKSELINSIA